MENTGRKQNNGPASPTDRGGDANGRDPHTNFLDELRRMRILVVDDNSDNIDLTRAMLAKSGFMNTVAASSGALALNLLAQNTANNQCRINLVLLDIMMPNMDGYEVCGRIRSQIDWADIPVIMITANATWQDEIANTSFTAGATDIMFKPIRRVELIPRVISALSLKRERDLRKSREDELVIELAERRIVEERLNHLVTHDDLTGLCNRRQLEKAMDRLVHLAEHSGVASGLLYLDLDQFKVINDLEGYTVGDEVLIAISRLLRRHFGAAHLVCRVSADEFAVVIEGADDKAVLGTAESLHRLMDNYRVDVNKRTYHIGASIGVVLIHPDDGLSASTILARANRACFAAKSRGRNLVHLYSKEDAEMDILRSAAHWVPIIRAALAEQRFCLVYQPVLNVANGRFQHYEVLIRLIDADNQLVSPVNFIPVAESMGLIHDIDRWVVLSAIRMLATLPPELAHVSLNINLSGHSFQDPTLFALIRDQITERGIDATRLIFEITETAAIANAEQTRQMIIRLRELGCQFALDDFGSGFNSFAYIKNFPVDFLKIDGSFITNLPNSAMDQSLVKSIIDVAHSLGKKTVAEFVENQAVLDMLTDLGIDYAQGYFVGEPRRTIDVRGDAHDGA
ncbi:MAG: diguanylate cyclase/phosphodiesterase (GGDEF & EAL domains) with PAS/PAC sensor(s) [Gammaproteobacteria bacterium]|nr:MAG: diguanylate cyclase/phosphodiesterase (GGDEF & EAL domains) with PAS/PAC sensor(s) [Gammaproteobacteria bacterium]TND06754.1 MAG: diguanylate cyclase/phosphodiesterase (GGDEF & EAL domains) with PAS/PAC sensor(s) [Gammaproteobacteria bacterium]